MVREFWRDGLFDDLDGRYYRSIDRSPTAGRSDRLALFGERVVVRAFPPIFRADNVHKEAYFDSMTHFDFKSLLPALLQVEDSVTMAHGLESRVRLVDHAVVDFAPPCRQT